MMDLKVLDRIREVWRLELRAPGLPATGRHVEVRHEADASRAGDLRAPHIPPERQLFVTLSGRRLGRLPF
jgi:hypothetical protein